MNPELNPYFEKSRTWQKEMSLLREIALECGLDEELKWRQACYTHKGSNIFLIASFKDYCTISFLKGELLADEKKLLQSPGENSQSVKLFKFTSIKEIDTLRDLIKAYIFEAIEKAGLKVVKTKSKDLDYPEELHAKFKEDPAFETAFEALTPGRKRGYILFIDSAKQSATKTSRIEK